MRSLALLVATLPLACTVGASSLELDLGSTPLVADGSSVRTIKVRNTSNEPISSAIVTLHASSGSWQGGKATDPTSVEVTLTSASTEASASWSPPARPGPVEFSAALGGAVIDRQEATLVAAEVETIELQSALLSTTDVSSVSLGVDFTTASGGDVSEGTIVTLRVADSDPPGQSYLSSSSIVAGKRDNVSLFSAAGTRSVRIEATLKANSKVVDCKTISPTGIAACN
jgi:hypothetical protein